MNNWIGIRTDERLIHCEEILISFGYIAVSQYSRNYGGYLWIGIEDKDFRYSTVGAYAEDLVIEASQLAETLLLHQLGVAL